MHPRSNCPEAASGGGGGGYQKSGGCGFGGRFYLFILLSLIPVLDFLPHRFFLPQSSHPPHL